MCPTESYTQRRRSRAGSNETELIFTNGSSIGGGCSTMSTPDSPRFPLFPKPLLDSGFSTTSIRGGEQSMNIGDEYQMGELESALASIANSSTPALTNEKSSKAAEKQSLFRDLCQTQLSLWTFTVSTLLTYFWQKRVNLRSLLFAMFAVGFTVFISGVLSTVVICAHLFNSDFAGSFLGGGGGIVGEWLNIDDDQKYPHLLRRQSSRRSSSSTSRRSSGSTTPRNGVGAAIANNQSTTLMTMLGGDKVQAARFWQKNVATLERSYVGSSRS